MLTTCIYLTIHYHLQLHLIRLQRPIPMIYGYTLRQYDNAAQIRHSDNLSPYTTAQTTLAKPAKAFIDGAGSSFLITWLRSILRLFIGRINQPSSSGPQSSHLWYIIIEASLADLALTVVCSNPAGVPTFLCTWPNLSTLLSFI
jgi:hypothetical protein